MDTPKLKPSNSIERKSIPKEPTNQNEFPQNISPLDITALAQLINIPYTKTLPTFTPRYNGYRIIYFDGTNYFLYVYANGGWRNQQFGITSYTEPSGVIKMYGGTVAPSGYLLCDGSAVSRTTYAALFTAIGTTFGAGDGSTTFNVPDFRRRVPVGTGGTGTGTLGSAVGNSGGEETHTLVTAEMPAHTHNAPDAGTGGSFANTYFTTQNNSGSPSPAPVTASTGGGGAHNNLQPSLVVSYIIKT